MSMKKVIIAGSSGMVGSLVMEYCLASDQVGQVVSLVRKRSNNKHPNLTEIEVNDFSDLSSYQTHFRDVAAAFFCIGVYTGTVPDPVFKQVTVDFASAFGRALANESPQARLCLLSGMGADRTEKSRVAFSRYKGMAENQLAEMKLAGFHSFRPAYIYPVRKRQEPNFMYRVSRFLYPLVRLLGKKYSIRSEELARAMVNIGLNGADKVILENPDILEHSGVHR